jgi:hypothetical protein
MKISVFKNLFNSKETPFDCTIQEIAFRIKHGTYDLQKKIKRIRELDSKDEEHKKLKQSLIAILFNGTFSERNDNSLIEHSGLCILDFDKYPDEETMMDERQRLILDPYIVMIFRSPGGKGLKALIKIPPSDKNEHKRRFKAFAKYIKSDFFDMANSNVSRVCYESFDPDLYMDLDKATFEGIDSDEGFSYIERVPVCILHDENKKIEIIEKFTFQSDYVDGQRNHFIFEVACVFCEYGITQQSTTQYLWNKYVNGSEDFSHHELERTVSSAFKKAQFNSKYFEDSQKIKTTLTKLSGGIADDDIKKQLNLSDDELEDIKNDSISADEVFWTINSKGVISIEPLRYCQFLVKSGFQKYYPETAEKPSFVKVKENKVRLSSVDQIKDFILSYLMEKNEHEVWNYCSKNSYLFLENHLNMIDCINLKMIQDTKTESFIPFKNCVVKVTSSEVEKISYLDVNGYIWENQIIPRNFETAIDFNNDFRDFVSKVSNQDPIRVKALESTLGYLIHTYKDKTDQKAIIFNDQEIDDNPNGGSGKSLMLTALGYFRRIVKIDGKSFNPAKSDFVYQRVNVDSQILAFDDVKRNFDFEQLFSIISEGITVNRKNKDEIFIPFERSPKIVITTNYVIAGSGSSHDRRRHELEFYQYFNQKRNPLVEYGRLLFDQWNEDDWMRFDNYMIKNLQIFLKKGLTQSVSINADAKRFIQGTNKDFFDFVLDNPMTPDIMYYNAELLNQFQNEYSRFNDLNPQRFATWLNKYAEWKGYDIEKGRNSTKGRYFEFKKIKTEQ